MKLLSVLVLNVFTVALALVVYDHLRGEHAPRGAVYEVEDPDVSDLERRLDAVEAERQPMLGASGADPRILERLGALEEALRTPDSTEPASEDESALTTEDPSEGSSDAPAAKRDEPKPEEIQWFRRVRDAAAREDRIQRNELRVDKALARLTLDLSKAQRKKIATALTDFQPQIGRIWDAAKLQAVETKKAGGTIDRAEIVSTTTALIQQEFVKTIDTVVSQADAEAVAQTLLAGGK